MAGEHRDKFFAGVQEHSQIKLRALERYLAPWSAKVGSPPGVDRVWVVDGFAGPGVYDSGAPGSPRIVLEHAERIAEEVRSSYQVSGFFVEDNKERYRRLRAERHRYPGVEAVCADANFWSQVDRVVEFVADAPALVFVDPFGLKELKFEPLVELCNRLTKVDLMVNFASPAARRLQKEHPSIVSEAVGGPGWTVETLTQTFCERLARACDFLKPAVLPVVAKIPRQTLKYEIVLTARHPAAYELWSDEIASSQGQILEGDDKLARDELIADARGLLRSLAPTNFTRNRLINDTQVRECGQFHSRVLRAAVKAMLDEGEWARAEGKIGTARMWKVST